MGQRTRCPCSTSASDSRRRVDPGKPRKTSNAPATENILSFNPTDLHDRGQHPSASPTQGAELTHQVPTQSLWRSKKRRCIVSPGVASIPVPCPFPRCPEHEDQMGEGGEGPRSPLTLLRVVPRLPGDSPCSLVLPTRASALHGPLLKGGRPLVRGHAALRVPAPPSATARTPPRVASRPRSDYRRHR